MNNYVGQLKDMIEWIMEKIASYLSLEIAEVKLVPFKLTDNEALKASMMDMWKSNILSASTLLEAFGMDYDEELEKMMNDTVSSAESQVETKDLVEKAIFAKSKGLASDKDSSGFADNRKEAYDEAAKILQTPPEAQQQALLALQAKDQTMYQSVMNIIENLPPAQQGEQDGQESAGTK